MVGRLRSFPIGWNGLFSGVNLLLVSGKVSLDRNLFWLSPQEFTWASVSCSSESGWSGWSGAGYKKTLFFGMVYLTYIYLQMNHSWIGKYTIQKRAFGIYKSIFRRAGLFLQWPQTKNSSERFECPWTTLPRSQDMKSKPRLEAILSERIRLDRRWVPSVLCRVAVTHDISGNIHNYIRRATVKVIYRITCNTCLMIFTYTHFFLASLLVTFWGWWVKPWPLKGRFHVASNKGIELGQGWLITWGSSWVVIYTYVEWQ